MLPDNQKSQKCEENFLVYFALIYGTNLFVDTIFDFPDTKQNKITYMSERE